MAVAVAYHLSDQDVSHYWDILRGQTPPGAAIPNGFPERITSSLAWNRQEMELKPSEWIVELSTDEVESLNEALRGLEGANIDYPDISADNFVLPEALHKRFRDISDRLYKGRGVVVLKGIDSSRYTEAQNVKLYAGVTAHIAPQRGWLDWDGEKVLCHVVNTAEITKDGKQTTPAFTNSPLSFHTDRCEILALYALDIAAEGGRTLVSSSWQLYNELADKRPDVLQTLADEWVQDTFQDYSKHPPVSGPLLHQQNDGQGALLRLSRHKVAGFGKKQRNPALPPLTEAQVDALNTVQVLATANAVPLPMAKGDMIFVNDMAVMHGREGYSDGDAPVKRHLLKFHLRDPEQDWPIPDGVKEYWKWRYGPNREDGSRAETWCPNYFSDLGFNGPENG